MTTVLSLKHEKGSLDVPDDAIVVGLDETGCEDYKDKNHPVFGLGGCAVVAKDYFQLIDDPWRRMKELFFGGAETQLHAADIKKPTIEQLEALERFFSKIPFFRFATMSAQTFDNQTEETNIHLLSLSIMNQVGKFATMVQPSGIIFIIEASERIERSLLKHLSAYRYGNGDIDFQPQILIASKQSKASCVEIADFVIHPAGAQVRNRLTGNINFENPIRKDFSAVFHKIDNRLSEYQELLSAAQSNA